MSGSACHDDYGAVADDGCAFFGGSMATLDGWRFGVTLVAALGSG